MRKLRLFILLTLIMGLLPLGVSTTEVGQVQAARLNANCATDLIISEYIEGSSFNKALEIYNGTGATVDLTGYRLSLYSNGSTTAGSTYDFSGTLANDDVFVVAHSSADAAIQSVADDNSGVANFNGNDAVVLSKEGTDIDVLGEVGNDAYWGGDVTLVRKATVNAPSTTFDSNDWDEYAQNTFSYLGSHTMTCAGELSLNKTAPAHVE
ncbi:MAG: lamin tail domain-containing protein, partial [Anaerolineae bacterium]